MPQKRFASILLRSRCFLQFFMQSVGKKPVFHAFSCLAIVAYLLNVDLLPFWLEVWLKPCFRFFAACCCCRRMANFGRLRWRSHKWHRCVKEVVVVVNVFVVVVFLLSRRHAVTTRLFVFCEICLVENQVFWKLCRLQNLKNLGTYRTTSWERFLEL